MRETKKHSIELPRVSVITVTYNSRATVCALLAALAAQEYPAHEVIVVDNFSMDGSADLVAAEFPAARLLRAPGNLGFAHANNLGAGAATGEYLVFLNPDTVPMPGFLTALIKYQHQHPHALVTAQVVLAEDPSRINTAGNVVHLTGLTVCRGLGALAGTLPYDQDASVGAVSGAAFSVPRAIFQHLGGFAGGFFLYLEDTELSLRARLAGYECRYTPTAVITHQYGAGFSPSKFYYLERNRYQMLMRIFHPATLVLLAPSLLLSEVITWGYALKSGPEYMARKLRSYRWLLSHRSHLRHEYHEVQRLRHCSDSVILAVLEGDLEFTQLAGRRVGRLAGQVLNRLFRWNLWLARRVLSRDPGAGRHAEMIIAR